LTPYVLDSFHFFNLCSELSLNSASLERCVLNLQSRYKQVPFHNFKHAFMTFHTVRALLYSLRLYSVFRVEDLAALLLAALGHDAEHPGVNNAFLVNSRGRLALLYNDISVLENHHAAVTYSVLQQKGDQHGLFEHMAANDMSRIRKVIINSILYTEMTKHNEIVEWLKEYQIDLPHPDVSAQDVEQMEPDIALKVEAAMLHGADLVHPTLPWSAHFRLSKYLAAEFYEQSREEARLGLPSLPFMAKDPADIPSLARVQDGFLQFVIVPLWTSWSHATGGDHLKFNLENIESNRKRWQLLSEGKEVDEANPPWIDIQNIEENWGGLGQDDPF
jgi:hypothetical protein